MPRILFITSNRIGDAVLTTGVLAWLANEHPKARFTVVCGPLAQDLFRAVPRLERMIVLHKKPLNLHWLWLWRRCVGTHWDLIVDFRNSLVSRLLAASKRAYRPVGMKERHKVEINAAALGLSPPPAPVIWTDDEAENSALRLMPTGAPVIALGPAANWPVKQWPAGKFVMLAQKLTAADGPLPGARLLIAAARHERESIAPLFRAFPDAQVIDAVGRNLLTVAACFKNCRLFIGNDSGLTHIAAAVGIPTLGLFGPGNEKMYAPWGPNGAFVRTPESAEDLLARLPRPGAHYPNLMETLRVERVYEAAVRLLSV